MNTYEIKQDVSGNDYLEMTTLNGVVSFVPMVAGNADYQAYLNPVEHLTEIPTSGE